MSVYRVHRNALKSLGAASIQGFPNMSFMKCLLGFAEVPYQVPFWSLPDAPRMPKHKSREAYLVAAPKTRLYRKVLVAKCLQGVQRDRARDSPFPPENALKKCTWSLQFPNAVVQNAVGRRSTQMNAKESANTSLQNKSAKESKRAQKSASA